MKRTRFTDEQIIGILAEHEAGAKCADLCRKHGMSEGTFYNWKAKFGGMTVSEAKRLKALEDENAKLKKLLAEQMSDLAAMKDLVLKKVVESAVKREAVTYLRAELGLSERRACHIVGADRTMIRYRSQRAPDTALRGGCGSCPTSAGGLPAPVRSAAPRGRAFGDQPNLSALPRGRADGAQT